MTNRSRSIRAVLFLLLGVALPFLVSEQVMIAHAAHRPDEGAWGIILSASCGLHLLFVATILYAWPWLKERKEASDQTAIVGTGLKVSLAAILLLYAAAVVALAAMW